jgi:hypothetical protein
MMRERVASLTIGLPRNARETVGWDTPAKWAMTSDVALSLGRIVMTTSSRGGAGLCGVAALCQTFAETFAALQRT